MQISAKKLISLVTLATLLQATAAIEYRCIDRHKNYCVVKNVTAEAFPSSVFPANETSLLIQNSTITNFSEQQFQQLPTVENLMIHHLKIEQLQLGKCDQLRTLFASYNHISELEAVEGLHLRNLDLYQNLLTNISAVRVLTELEQLYLNDNLLEVLEMDTFAEMKSLKILTLHRNQLTAIDTQQAINLPSLESLFIQHNKLIYLDTGLWKMPALKTLDLGDNDLAFLFTFLEEFPSLRAVELYENDWNCAWLSKIMDRLVARGIQHAQADRSCEGALMADICCLIEGASPDPMMLLISRTALVDDLNDQLGNQRQKMESLKEAQRKQTHKYDEMQRKIERMEAFCRDEL
ncbi:protein artichoke-like [Topomyia yanbarensis]|uniref:protein artichoke-like n=1 Tax=Topomyia yanbarensis TaxID=2498891 RepID=UPI00273B885F|nr:protein artichoke-like [Topomyia yanbarensis]